MAKPKDPASNTTPPSTPTLDGDIQRILDTRRLRVAAGDCEDSHEPRRRAIQVANLAADLGPRYTAVKTCLTKFDLYHAAQKEALASLVAMIDDLPDRISSGAGLVLYGPPGTGKDHLLAHILYHAAATGAAPRWCHGLDLFGAFRDAMKDGRTEGEIFEKWFNPKVIGLSDIIPPGGTLSDYNTSQVLRLVDSRYRALKSTWITLNVLDEKDAKARLTPPVWDRLIENALVLWCHWPSYRERNRL